MNNGKARHEEETYRQTHDPKQQKPHGMGTAFVVSRDGTISPTTEPTIVYQGASRQTGDRATFEASPKEWK